MTLEDFLAEHPGWQAEQRPPLTPEFRAVDESGRDEPVAADSIDELHAKVERLSGVAA